MPRTSASPTFTSDVLRTIRRTRREPRTSFVWRMAAAVTMAVCLVAVAQVGVMQYTHRRHVAAIRAEQQKIQAELEAVKKIANESEPVVVLENDQGTRVIVDYDAAVQPASLRTFD
ncbi:MAG TPA: hypothetical protein VF824_13970 [Thermoanaerobaculia bacterium]